MRKVVIIPHKEHTTIEVVSENSVQMQELSGSFKFIYLHNDNILLEDYNYLINHYYEESHFVLYSIKQDKIIDTLQIKHYKYLYTYSYPFIDYQKGIVYTTDMKRRKLYIIEEEDNKIKLQKLQGLHGGKLDLYINYGYNIQIIAKEKKNSFSHSYYKYDAETKELKIATHPDTSDKCDYVREHDTHRFRIEFAGIFGYMEGKNIVFADKTMIKISISKLLKEFERIGYKIKKDIFEYANDPITYLYPITEHGKTIYILSLNHKNYFIVDWQGTILIPKSYDDIITMTFKNKEYIFAVSKGKQDEIDMIKADMNIHGIKTNHLDFPRFFVYRDNLFYYDKNKRIAIHFETGKVIENFFYDRTHLINTDHIIFKKDDILREMYYFPAYDTSVVINDDYFNELTIINEIIVLKEEEQTPLDDLMSLIVDNHSNKKCNIIAER